MKPPIIVDSQGDLLLFESVEKAERYLEPIDIEGELVPIFDSEGRRLVARIVPDKIGWWGQTAKVTLSLAEEEAANETDLRMLLIEFLNKVRAESPNPLHLLPLKELIRMAKPFKIE